MNGNNPPWEDDHGLGGFSIRGYIEEDTHLVRFNDPHTEEVANRSMGAFQNNCRSMA